MSDIKIIFVFLKVIELIVFIVSGYILWKLKSNKKYWKIAIYPIVTYAIVEGLRFGRLIDWNQYYLRYNEIGNNINSLDYEPLFKGILYISYNLGIPYYIFICLQTTFLIICIFILIKKYKNAIIFIVPLILFETSSNEQLIRWYLGFSFILLSINELTNKNKIKTYFFLYCATLIHIGFWIFFPFIFFSKVFNKRTIPPFISISLFFATSFLLNLSDMLFISTITESIVSANLGLNEKVTSYLHASERLMSGEWGYVGIMDINLSGKIRYFLAYAPTILFAKRYCSNYSYGIFFYNLFVIGAILSPLFLLVEIFDRIIKVFLFFSIIANGLFFYNTLKYRKTISKYLLIIISVSYLCNIYPNISNALRRTQDITMLYIWNANGREYIRNFPI